MRRPIYSVNLRVEHVLGFLLGVSVACGVFAQGSEPPRTGAMVKDLQGTLSVQSGNNPPQASRQGVPIPIGAVVRTGAGSSAMLIFADGQACALGQNSTFRVASQSCNSGNAVKNEMSINLMSGSMRCVTGNIAQANPEALRMQLGVMTLGADASSAPRTDVSAVVQGGTTVVTVGRGGMVAFMPSGAPLPVPAGQGLILGPNNSVSRGTAAQIMQQAGTGPSGPQLQQQFAALQGAGQGIAQTEAALSNPVSAQQLFALFECLPPPGESVPVLATAVTPPTGAAGGGLPCTASCN